MPRKKTPHNAFYFFMMDYKKDQAKLGVTFSNNKELADVAGALWPKLAPNLRKKYEDMAKQEKERQRASGERYTSTGVPISLIERQQKEAKLAEENERKDIQNMIKLKAFDQGILTEDFYIIDVNSYCKTNNGYLIGEFTVIQFNLKEGIKSSYHDTIVPLYAPVGYMYDVKTGGEELCMELPLLDEPPDYHEPNQPGYIQILANIIDYLKQKDRTMTMLPPFFTIIEKVDQVQDFVTQMCAYAGEDDSLFRVYKLETFFFTLINAIKTHDDEGFPKESLAIQQMKKDLFDYTPGIACQHHESLDKSNYCTTSRVKRWAFTLFDRSCPILGIAPIPGKHLPFEYDINSILIFKEERKARAGPSVPHTIDTGLYDEAVGGTLDEAAGGIDNEPAQGNNNKRGQASAGYNAQMSRGYYNEPRRGRYNEAPQSTNTSFVNDSLNESFQSMNTTGESVPSTSTGTRRVHKPLRMPRTDYSHIIQQAPELTEANFPTLTGHGRGRGMARTNN